MERSFRRPERVVGVQLSGGVERVPSTSPPLTPKFDGTDVWTVIPSSVLGGGDLIGSDCRKVSTGCIPEESDTNAFVRSGVVVARLDVQLPIVTQTSSFVLEYLAATLTARLTRVGIYELAKKTACDAQDLTADPSRDRTNARSDAIRNAITFTAVSVTLGSIQDLSKNDTDCLGFSDRCD